LVRNHLAEKRQQKKKGHQEGWKKPTKAAKKPGPPAQNETSHTDFSKDEQGAVNQVSKNNQFTAAHNQKETMPLDNW